jgi:transcriptional regulator with XRE-family HTH domain
VSRLIEEMQRNFVDEDYRNAYVESFMNSFVAAQIKVLREENEMTQEQLAERIGTKQAGISRLENVNYSAWKVETLRKLARAFKVRLKITFEEFGSLPGEVEGFNREVLLRVPFDKDPLFCAAPALGTIDVLAKLPPQSDFGKVSIFKRGNAEAQANGAEQYATA